MRPTAKDIERFKKHGKFTPKENRLQDQICRYLKMQYPNCLFRVDFGAGAVLTGIQAAQQTRQQKSRGWPDLFIYEPRKGFAGLFIELKREGETIYNSKGLFRSEHLHEQNEVHVMLRERGFTGGFAKGFDQARELIDGYLK
jgi:hypothetical protein